MAIVYQPLARVAPGIGAALSEQGIDVIRIDQGSEIEKQLPNETAILALGAVFESFALDLFAWAKLRQIPVIAFQEVAQLALNQLDINNYDAPFDRLFVASPGEQRRFVDLGYPNEMLSISGLLANDRLGANETGRGDEMLAKLGSPDGKNPIVYTTSPIRNRLSLHNKDDLHFREAVFAQIAIATRKTGRRAVIKLHPNEDLEAAQARIRKFIPDAIVLGRRVSVDELFPIIGVLVNRGNSQTCLDAVLRGIPTVVIASGLKTLFHDDGGADIVEDLSKLSDVIERACNQGSIDALSVKAKHFFLPPEGVAAFIANEISNLVSNPPRVTENTWNWLLKTTLFVGRHDRALQLCERIGPRTPWQESVHLALKSHAEGRLENAIAAWRECAALDHHWFFPHYELAHGFQATGQFAKAIEYAHKAIELHSPFHSLWHEIPMRVVIMASHRQTGDIVRAASELKLMEDRGVVDIVPELLIEKAGQLATANDRLDEAAQCLDNANRQLIDYPVNETTDAQLVERAALQYLDVAKCYAATGDRSRSLVCLERTAKITSGIRPITEPIVSRFLELGQQWENDKDLHAAEECYNLAAENYSGDHMSRYNRARIALKQGKLYTAIGALHELIEIPDGPKHAVVRVLSPAAAARVLGYWPVRPKSILRPIKLSAYAFAWAVRRIVTSGFKDFFEAGTALLMIWMFIGRHFTRRLQQELRHVWSGRAGAPPIIERHHGTWHHCDLGWMAGLVRNVPGDFAEIGVFRGTTFQKLALHAHDQGKLSHAFDSFSGMAEPSVYDGTQYPRGKFDIGGPEQFIALMNEAGVPRTHYQIWPGYTPLCFENVPASLRFSLAILDVDHYQPTADSIAWLAPRITAGGILALDDFVEPQTTLATRAIKEFLAKKPHFDIIATFNQQLILRKR